MAYDIIVIGAGMVGSSIAWHLQKSNANVLLIDRAPPGQETSYGNAGLIQREAVFPPPYPRAFSETLSVLPNQRPDIRYHLAGVLRYAPALISYRYYSTPARWHAIVKEWAQLIQTCLDEHETIIKAAGADALIRKNGWLQLHRKNLSFKQAQIDARIANEYYGVKYRVLSPDDLRAIEPDLVTEHFVGAIHWQNSWQVLDPGGLVKHYAENFKQQGGEFKQKRVTALKPAGNTWQVIMGKNTLEAQHVVLATGPWAMQLLKPLGYHFPLFPKRGYHWHYEPDDTQRLKYSIFDIDNGYLLNPMNMGIRLTTGAEMTTLHGPVKTSQIRLCERIARELISFGSAIEPQPWFGSRPCLPDMKPIIGPAPKHARLWLAFGHAHQGFTLGPTTGRLMADMIFNRSPFIDPSPFTASRFN